MKLFFLLIICALPIVSWAQVRSYFNQNQAHSYVDPYRKISRPGDNLEQVLISEVAQARKSIYVAVQEMRLPLLAQALIDKKKAGVDVRIVMEHDYNFTVVDQRDINNDEHEASKLAELKAFVDVNHNGKLEVAELEVRDAVYMIRKAGIPVLDDTSDGSTGSGLMHHKFMVIDGSTTVVTSANFTMSCVHGDTLAPASRGNANSMVVVPSTEFARLFTEEMSQLWGNGRQGNYGQRKSYRGPRTVSVGGTRITIQFSPSPKRLDWNASTNGLIAKHLATANSSIKSALFVFSDQLLADAMQERFDRRVAVGAIIEPKFAYRPYSELLDLLGVQMPGANCAYEPGNNPWKVGTTEAGKANLPDGDVLHHKFSVIDRRVTIMGSHNWSESANYTNDETLLVIENSAISEAFSQEYERVKRNSTLGITAWLQSEIKRLDSACPHR